MCPVLNQVQGGASSSGTAALYMYKGPLDAMFQIGTKEGLRTLYKGFSTVTQIAPTQAMYMATYQTSKRYLPGEEFCGSCPLLLLLLLYLLAMSLFYR